jgi:hypothetical protein
MQLSVPRYDESVANEPLTLSALIQFHREIVAPDLDRIVSRLDRVDARFDDVFAHFDEIYKRFDRLESEYQAL